MPFCNLVFLFRFFLELKVKNQRRCVPLGGRASHRAEQEVRRVVEFHSTGNYYFYIYNLFYNNFKGSIPFITNIIKFIYKVISYFIIYLPKVQALIKYLKDKNCCRKSIKVQGIVDIRPPNIKDANTGINSWIDNSRIEIRTFKQMHNGVQAWHSLIFSYRSGESHVKIISIKLPLPLFIN